MSNCKGQSDGEHNNYIAYATNSHKGFIILSSISLIINGIDIIFYVVSSKKKQKNKSSSVDKMLFLLVIIEALISIYWLINSTLLHNEALIQEYCIPCRVISLFGLFCYNMEWVMISLIIFQLRKIITNPVNGVLNADFQIKIYILIDVIIAALCTFIGATSQVEGISPINTCFINGSSQANQPAVVWVLISVPIVNLLFGLFHIYRIIFSKATQHDIEMLSLFSKNMIYISLYLLCSLFFIIIYFADQFSKISNNKAFQWFIYVSSMFFCINSTLFYIIRYTQKYFRVDLFKKQLSRRKMKEYVYDLKDIISMPLTDNDEFSWLEKKVITNFMRDVFTSISYCLVKNVENNQSKIMDSSIDKDYCLETKSYTINPSLIEKESVVKDILGRDELIKNTEYLKIKVVEYAPKIFSLLRRMDNLDDINMAYSLLPSKNQIGISKSQGRSDDHNYIIKTINYEDVELIRDILLEHLSKHVKLYPSSLIGRIYGLFKLVLPNGDEVIMLLMRNVYGVFNEDNILCKFDLKGSKLNRKENLEKSALENTVMKDLNFDEIERSLLLTQEDKNRLIQNAKKDAHMLSSLGIMDYSLLIIKLSFNKDEIIALFGSQHKKKIEHNVQQMLSNQQGEVPNSKKTESLISNFFEEEDKALGGDGYNINNLRFNLEKVSNLKKYMFPSLQYHIVYIAAIIDFFQLYNMRKNIETKFKLIKALKEDISSIPPNEYMQRFINNLSKITNSEGLIKNNDILSRDNIIIS